MKRPLFAKITDEVYRNTILLAAHCDDKALDKLLYKAGIGAELGPCESLGGAYFEITNGKGIGIHLIWMPVYDGGTESLTCLVHEICHCATSVFQNADSKIDFDTSEPFCYYVQWLLRECLNVLSSRRVKK